MALAVVPALDSPFLAAKSGVLLLCGALAAVFLASADRASAVSAHTEAGTRAVQFAAFACCAAACVSLLLTRHWAEAWPVLAPLAAAVCVFLALLRSRARAATLFAAISTAAVGVALFAVAGRAGFDLPRLLTGTPAPGRMSAAATLGNPMFVASFLAASFWSILGLQLLRRAWRYAAAAVVVAGMAATAERTAALAFVAGAVVYFASSRRTRTTVAAPCASAAASRAPSASASRHRAFQFGAALLAAGMLFAAARTSNPRSFGTAFSGRVFLWSTALRHVTLFGAGPGSFYRVYNPHLLAESPSLAPQSFHFVRYESDAHSIAVQALAEIGIAGFLALAAALALWFRFAWQRREENAAVRCALAGVAAFVAAGLVDDPLARPEGLALIAFLLAVPWLCAAQRRADIPEYSAPPFARSATARRFAVPAFGAIALALIAASAATLFASYAVAQGNVAESRADWSAAERRDRAALRAEPASRDARFNLVRVLCQSERYDACLAESDNALAWVNEAELHLIRVRALEMLGRADGAQAELAAARREFPWSTDLQNEQIELQTEASPTQSVVVELNKE